MPESVDFQPTAAHNPLKGDAKRRRLGLALALLFAPPLNAVTLGYTVTPVAGDTWEYVYTLHNDGSTGTAVHGVTIEFDPALYRADSLRMLTPGGAPWGWTERLLAPGIGLSAAYDLSGPGLAEGQSLGGFTVRADWIGDGVPGAQHYQVYEPGGYQTVAMGESEAVIRDAIPLPGLWLSALLAGGIGLLGRRALAPHRTAKTEPQGERT